MPIIICPPYKPVIAPFQPQTGTATMLLHFDDATGSTVIKDEVKARTWTRIGTPQISNVKSKFGETSLDVVNKGYFSAPGEESFKFYSGDFTIEAWVNITGDALYGNTICGTYTPFNGWNFAVNSAADGYGIALIICSSGSSYNPAVQLITYNTKLPLNAWNHVAATRKNGLVTLWLNGQPVANKVINVIDNHPGNLTVGGFASYYSNLYIDELRLVNGEAIYTVPFTPAVAPFTV